jgi:Zn ribbon nucleic-acid-binding protein
MFRKWVECSNCGFLALSRPEPELLQELRLWKELDLIGPMECVQGGRNRINDGTHAAPEMLTCIRHVWSSDIEDNRKAEIFNNLNSNRKCPYFFPYHPGYSPVEHKELQREARSQGILIIGMLLAAFIGAGAAILAGFIAN